MYKNILLTIIVSFLLLVGLNTKTSAEAMLSITEVLPNPVGTDTLNEYIEIVNMSNEAILLSDLTIDNQKISPVFETYTQIEPNQFLVVYDDNFDQSNKTLNINYKQGIIGNTGLTNTSDKVELKYMGNLVDTFSYSQTQEGKSILKPILSCSQTEIAQETQLGTFIKINDFTDYLPNLEINLNGVWSPINFDNINSTVNLRFTNNKCGVLTKYFQWSNDNATWTDLTDQNTVSNINSNSQFYLKYIPSQEIFSYKKPIQITAKINEVWLTEFPHDECKLDSKYNYLFEKWIEVKGEIPNDVNITISDEQNRNIEINKEDSLSNTSFQVFKIIGEIGLDAKKLIIYANNKEFDRVEFNNEQIPSSQSREGLSLEFGYTPTPGAENIILDSNALRINEILPNPSTDNEWVELYNSSNNLLFLNDYFINDSTSTKHQLVCKTINPKSYYVLESSELKISLNNTGDTVEIYNNFNNQISKTSYGNIEKDFSWAYDGSQFKLTSQPTKLKKNIIEINNEDSDIDNVESTTSNNSESSNKSIQLPQSSPINSQILGLQISSPYINYKKPQMYVDKEIELEKETILPLQSKNNNLEYKFFGIVLIIGSSLGLTQIEESNNFLKEVWKFIEKKLNL